MKVKIAIITIGVRMAHNIPSAEPLYRATRSRRASDSTNSDRLGSSQSGRQTARRAV